MFSSIFVKFNGFVVPDSTFKTYSYLTLLLIFQVVEIIGGGGNDMFAPPPQYFHWGATAPPPPGSTPLSNIFGNIKIHMNPGNFNHKSSNFLRNYTIIFFLITSYRFA